MEQTKEKDCFLEELLRRKLELTTCGFSLPTYNTGYVYLLMSLVSQEEIYIGQTGRNILMRLKEHNSGISATETGISAFMPWGGCCLYRQSGLCEPTRKT